MKGQIFTNGSSAKNQSNLGISNVRVLTPKSRHFVVSMPQGSHGWPANDNTISSSHDLSLDALTSTFHDDDSVLMHTRHEELMELLVLGHSLRGSSSPLAALPPEIIPDFLGPAIRQLSLSVRWSVGCLTPPRSLPVDRVKKPVSDMRRRIAYSRRSTTLKENSTRHPQYWHRIPTDRIPLPNIFADSPESDFLSGWNGQVCMRSAGTPAAEMDTRGVAHGLHLNLHQRSRCLHVDNMQASIFDERIFEIE